MVKTIGMTIVLLIPRLKPWAMVIHRCYPEFVTSIKFIIKNELNSP